MTAAPLRSPSATFFSQKLHLKRVHPSTLVRVSGHATGEPYFGHSGANRFDDPDPGSPTRFGTCYFGDSLLVAVAETLLHEERPRNGMYHIAPDRLKSRFVPSFAGSPLMLADFTGTALKRLGLHAGLSGTASYKRHSDGRKPFTIIRPMWMDSFTWHAISTPLERSSCSTGLSRKSIRMQLCPCYYIRM